MLEPLQLTVPFDGEPVTVPHWVVNRPETDWPLYDSFATFLERVWDHLGLPEPSRAQREIAHRLQFGVDTAEAFRAEDPTDETPIAEAAREVVFGDRPREDIVRAFRGLGKSYVTAAFAIWRVMRNPRDEKVLVVSATSSKAKEFVSQAKGIIASMPELRWLLEGQRELGAMRRDTADEFDVAMSSLSQSFSIAARGITGQITGSRATLLISDDIEIEKNSKTQEARERILNIVRSDFVPITKTEHGKGDIIFLGTPQTEESVYNVLVAEMGFRCMCIPARFPGPDKRENYVITTEGHARVDILATYLTTMRERGEIREGEGTDARFTEDELIGIEAKGRAQFALQYMLDTSLSDAERYPLKLHDLTVFSTNSMKAPRIVQWGLDSNRHNLIKDIPNLGFSGDYLMRPLFVDPEWIDYEQKIIFVDPAGRGKDETAWCVLGQLHGLIYLIDLKGEIGDPATAMTRIAEDVRRHDVREVVVEPNFGQGMWLTAFIPILQRVSPGSTCGCIESAWAKGQKETRIIDTLEPVTSGHRLVVNESVLRADVKAEERSYSFMYQFTHITRDRGCLTHDDRVDCVAGGVAHFIRSMSVDVQDARGAQIEAERQELIDAFQESLEGGPPLWKGRELAVDLRNEVWSHEFMNG